MSALSIPPLSEIIHLEPDMEPWCAGYAPSKGRRCHMRTNIRGRTSAMRLLDQGTADLRAGRRIDALLEDLAPHVLCTRWHQNQAPNLVRRWKEQVEQYLDSPVPSARSRRSTRQSSMSVPAAATRDDVEAQCAVLYQKLRDIMLELNRLQAVRQEATVASNAPPRRGGRQASEDSNPISTESETLGSDTVANPDESTEGTRSTVSSDSLATNGPSEVQFRASVEGSPVPASERRPTAAPTESIVSDDTVRQDDDETDSQTASPASEASSVRRTVDGDCGICLCDLQTSQSDSDTAGEAEEGEGEEGQNRVLDEGNVGEELVWCKARCGVNFHKACIDQWLETATAPTCPTCRSPWES